MAITIQDTTLIYQSDKQAIRVKINGGCVKIYKFVGADELELDFQTAEALYDALAAVVPVIKTLPLMNPQRTEPNAD